MKRFLYLIYYFRKLDWSKFWKFVSYVQEKKHWSKFRIISQSIFNSLRYNISILEYFQFLFFFEQSNEEKARWAGTGYMYEYQLLMNPREKRNILDDKRKFYKNYKEFFSREVASLDDLIKNKDTAKCILSNKSGKIVFKTAHGKCGKQVELRQTSEFVHESLIDFMKKSGYDVAEEFINQHENLNELSPSATNTVRIITQLNAQNDVEILGCCLRISVNSFVDNLAAGNIAATVDERTGIVNGPGVYSDITKPKEKKHPVTGVNIVGFQVPFWKEALKMSKKAAKKHPQNRSIGWDIVITEQGPELVEGNHDWCKLLWQLPVQRGLKPILEKHFHEWIH